MTLRSVAILIVACFALPRHAWADGLHVVSDRFGAWSETVSAIESNPVADGTSFGLRVVDDAGHAVGCDAYGLRLDEIAARAFALGGCDPTTDVTSATLVHRSALYSHDSGIVPVPLAAGIAVEEHRHAAFAGRAEVGVVARVQCSLALTPMIPDLEHGTRVAAIPGRYVLTVSDRRVTVDNDVSGWHLHGPGATTLDIDYELHDTVQNTVVLRERVMLACGTHDERTVAAALPSPSEVSPAPQSTGADACATRDFVPPGTSIDATVAHFAVAQGPGRHDHWLAIDRRSVVHVSMASRSRLFLAVHRAGVRDDGVGE